MPYRKRTTRRKRGGSQSEEFRRRSRSKAAPGFKRWFMNSALPWIKKALPAAHKLVKDNKLISKGIRKAGTKYDGRYSALIPILASGVEYMGYGKRRGAKMIKYKRRGRGLNHTGGRKKCPKNCRRRKRR